MMNKIYNIILVFTALFMTAISSAEEIAVKPKYEYATKASIETEQIAANTYATSALESRRASEINALKPAVEATVHIDAISLLDIIKVNPFEISDAYVILQSLVFGIFEELDGIEQLSAYSQIDKVDIDKLDDIRKLMVAIVESDDFSEFINKFILAENPNIDISLTKELLAVMANGVVTQSNTNQFILAENQSVNVSLTPELLDALASGLDDYSTITNQIAGTSQFELKFIMIEHLMSKMIEQIGVETISDEFIAAVKLLPEYGEITSLLISQNEEVEIEEIKQAFKRLDTLIMTYSLISKMKSAKTAMTDDDFFNILKRAFPNFVLDEFGNQLDWSKPEDRLLINNRINEYLIFRSKHTIIRK